MSKKILVADDSPTIQKVVGITLAKTDYELFEALNSEEMLDNLKSDQFDLVLLDFNLAEEEDGYELCQKIKEASPNIKILAMLGTFDSVDEERLKSLGVDEQVVKPFESSVFIQKIKDCLAKVVENQDSQEDDSHVEEAGLSSDDDLNTDSEEDEWSMSGVPGNDLDMDLGGEDTNFETDSQEFNMNSANELRNEMEDWGVTIPEVIGESSDSGALMPPKMGETSSQMVSIDELMDSDEDEEFLDKTDPAIQLTTLEDSEDLVSEINDESDADFWAVDEDDTNTKDIQEVKIDLQDEIDDDEDFVVEEHPVIEEVGPKLEKDKGFEPTIQALNELHEHEEEVGFSPDQILQKLRPQLKDLIREVIEEMGSEATERVAWEVIPDLAENLIREEVKNLSKKVQDKHSLS